MPESWKVGRHGTVVSSHPTTDRKDSGHGDVEYYGGYLVAESIANPAHATLIAAAPDTAKERDKLRNVLMRLWVEWETLDMQDVLDIVNEALGKDKGYGHEPDYRKG